MGLDQYFFVCEQDEDPAEVTAGHEDYYYRKHADLNGKIQEIWKRTNEDKDPDEFNCTPVVLSLGDIRELVDYGRGNLKGHQYGDYQGFFWGTSYPEQWMDFLEVAKKLEKAIEDGKKIVYMAWW